MRPYFIVSPPWTHMSSGIRTMHLLTHHLNEAGQKAWLIPTDARQPYCRDHSLNTPIIDCQDPDPIVVYPEIIESNPHNARRVVRYVLGQQDNPTFAKNDMIWGCTSALARKYGSFDVLTIPTFDRNIFFNRNLPRSGSCFYAQKYDRVLRHKLLPITEGMTRVEGSPERCAEIYNTHETCYVYEDTEVIFNASLCGCKVVMVKNDYFNTIPDDNEFYLFSGLSWSDGEEYHPKNMVYRDALELCMVMEKTFPQHLQRFIEKTQKSSC